MKQTRLITESTFREEVRDYVTFRGGLRSAARTIGIDASYLCDFLKGRKHGGAKLGKAFGLLPIVAFVNLPHQSD